VGDERSKEGEIKADRREGPWLDSVGLILIGGFPEFDGTAVFMH